VHSSVFCSSRIDMGKTHKCMGKLYEYDGKSSSESNVFSESRRSYDEKVNFLNDVASKVCFHTRSRRLSCRLLRVLISFSSRMQILIHVSPIRSKRGTPQARVAPESSQRLLGRSHKSCRWIFSNLWAHVHGSFPLLHHAKSVES